MSGFLLRKRLFAGLVAAVLLAAACENGNLFPTEPHIPLPDRSALVRGLALSPRGFPATFQELPAFFTEIAALETGGVMWNGPWREDIENGSDAGRIPAAATLVTQESRRHGITPITVFGWHTGGAAYLAVPGNTSNRWTNMEARAAFRTMVVEFARVHQPPFLFLGNESDFYYEHEPADYLNWVAFYNEAYDAIKAVSPATRVGPNFNFEHLAGIGGHVGWTTPQWNALTLHNDARMDVVGVTVYPFFAHARAADVPETYLDPLFSSIGRLPIAITETGWPAERRSDVPEPPWETSEAAQVTYLDRLEDILLRREIHLVNWLFLHPMQYDFSLPVQWAYFASISLRNNAGGKRPVYDPFTRFLDR